MTVETGTATDVYDLLDKIGVFAGTLGWTVNKTTASELYLQNGSDYYALKADDDLDSIDFGAIMNSFADYNHPGIACFGARGFDGGLSWDSQPGDSGYPALLGVFNQTDVKEYLLLSNAAGDYIHVLARKDAFMWCAMILGTLDKFGTWTGGAYVSGMPVRGDNAFYDNTLFDSSDRNTAVNADVDGNTDQWHTTTNTRNGSLLLQCLKNFFESLAVENLDPADWSGRGAMFPLWALINRGGGNYSYAGTVPDVRHYYHPTLTGGAEFTVGSDTWKFVAHYAFRLIP
ncbi:MAG: hypothetical protein WD750_05750 [Gammaproteobacteria bacterium]